VAKPANLTVLAYETLNGMTRDEVRRLAQHLNVPRGRDKKNTVANVAQAIHAGKAQLKSVVTIFATPTSGLGHGPTLYSAKLRSYKPTRVLYTVPAVS
jgi:hypothetical protein